VRVGGFSKDLANVAKRRNSAENAKAEIRRLVLAQVPKPTAVFEAFAGAGAMYRAVWHGADRYLGCDLDWWRDGRLAYVADNRRVMRSIDLGPFNVFDLDSYGSPWEQAIILSARRTAAPGEIIGLVVTEGSGLKLKQGGMPKALQLLTGMKGRPAGINRAQDDLISAALKSVAERMNCSVVRRWQAHRKGAADMHYTGVILQGLPAA
jgi:hypothetical protein